jgi:hypothetical protein
MNNFPTALEARAGSRNNLVIHAEIRFIEAAIYQAIANGVLNLDIKDSPMTNPSSPDFDDPTKVDPLDYYTVLFEDDDNRSLKEQIDYVQKNFVDLGYQVTPLKNTGSGRTFFWRIMW